MDEVTTFFVNQGVAAVVLGGLLFGIIKAAKWIAANAVVPVVAAHKEYLASQSDCMQEMHTALSELMRLTREIHKETTP